MARMVDFTDLREMARDARDARLVYTIHFGDEVEHELEDAHGASFKGTYEEAKAWLDSYAESQRR